MIGHTYQIHCSSLNIENEIVIIVFGDIVCLCCLFVILSVQLHGSPDFCILGGSYTRVNGDMHDMRGLVISWEHLTV